MSNQSFATRVDSITQEKLGATGATKWSDPGVIGAFVAEMDFGIAEVITDALRVFVDEGAFGYTPQRYKDELREATANRLGSHHGWKIEPAQVTPVPDVLKALELAITEFSVPGSKVIVPTPAYMPFLTVPPRLGREVLEVPMLRGEERWSFDLTAIQQAFDAGGRCFILCNPHNPLGQVFGRDELLALSEVIERNGGRVFSDEIWAPVVYPSNELIPYATISETTSGHTITATSASKAWNLPGLKCAELITSNAKDTKKMEELGMWAGHGTATAGMVANTAAFRSGESWLSEALQYLQGNRDELVALVATEMPGVQVTIPQATYIAWMDFSNVGINDPADFFRQYANVALTDGAACGLAGRGCARFVFAMPRPLMRAAIASMGKALRTRQ